MRGLHFAMVFLVPGALATSAGPAATSNEPLPDTTIILRVGDRVVTARDFVNSYENAWPPDRPGRDSLGRIAFLNTLVNKELLASVARRAAKPLGFEERTQLREHTRRVLSNVLFRRAVLDSIVVDEAEVARRFDGARNESEVRHVLLPDHATAERVRAELVARRLSWSDARRRFSIAKNDSGPDGQLGWYSRMLPQRRVPASVLQLEPGQISTPYEDERGIHLYTVGAIRPSSRPVHGGVRPQIRSEVRQEQVAARGEKLNQALRDEIGLVYDTTNIAWAARRFELPIMVDDTEIIINESLPEFTPADTSRVLARHREGRFTVGDFMSGYSAIPPAMRRPVNTLALLQSDLDGYVLEPYRARLAERRGLANDPLARKMIETKIDGLMVEAMYRDSIESKIAAAGPAARKRYYDAHLTDYHTYARVRYATFGVPSKARAESLAARLRAGEKAEAILRADSLAGRPSGVMRELSEEERGDPNRALLFENLRPGQVEILGPARDGGFVVLQSLAFDAGRQLSFKEAEHWVDETLQNQDAEKRLAAFIARHKRRVKIEARPELLMRIDMTAPADDPGR